MSRLIARCVGLPLWDEYRNTLASLMNGSVRVFPSLPRFIVEQIRWDIIPQDEWQGEAEDVYLKESRASLYSLSKALRTTDLSDHRTFVFCDNQITVSVCNEGLLSKRIERPVSSYPLTRPSTRSPSAMGIH